MNLVDATDLSRMQTSAAEAAAFLRLFANDRRLLVLCHLMEGERSVTWLAERVDLSPSALSQHLTRLRADRLVRTRREGQTIHYRLADARVARLLGLLYEMFCEPGGAP